MVGVLPGPDAGALLGLHEVVLAVVLGVHQGHIALIGLAGLVHHLKDALCTGQCHDHAVGLHRHLTDGHIEALVQTEEGHHRAKGHAADTAHSHGGTHQRAHGVADVAQLGVDRHHDVGEGVGLLGALLQLVVQLAEAVKGLLLVGEHLDHLLALHHLFDVAVHLAQIPLLLDEVLTGACRDLFGAEQHQRHHEHGNDGQLPAEHTHAEEHRHDGDDAGHQLRDALADHLAQGIYIVGVHGHDIAVGMGVKIGDGQAFHVGEQLGAQVAQRALRYVDHNAGIDPCCQNTHKVDAAHPQQCPGQRCKAGVLLVGHGHDIIVHQSLQKQAGLHISQRTDHDADKHKDAVGQVVAEHFIHDAPEQLARVFHLGFRAHAAGTAGAFYLFYLCHYCSPPCLSKSPPPWVWLL